MHELAHLPWLEVSYSFKPANQLLKLVPTNMYSHAKAVLCAHVNSPAAFEQKKESPDQRRCPFCRNQVMAHFHHVLWARPHFAATRPTWTVSPLEANLGWPEATTHLRFTHLHVSCIWQRFVQLFWFGTMAAHKGE